MARAEEAEAENKKLSQQLLEREQEITSLQHKLAVSDESIEKYEATLTQSKAAALDAESSKTTNDGLQRKVQLLEEELDAAEKHSKEVVEKCVAVMFSMTADIISDAVIYPGSDRSTSRPRSSSVVYRDLSRSATIGRRNTKYVVAPAELFYVYCIHAELLTLMPPPGSAREVQKVPGGAGRARPVYGGSLSSLPLCYASVTVTIITRLALHDTITEMSPLWVLNLTVY